VKPWNACAYSSRGEESVRQVIALLFLFACSVYDRFLDTQRADIMVKIWLTARQPFILPAANDWDML
jgi:hypothetical protein